MNRVLLVGGVVFLTNIAIAADWRAMTQACKAKPPTEIASCIREGAKALEDEEKKENDLAQQKLKDQADSSVRFVLRDTASSVTSFSGSTLGEKGASFNALRSNGEDATQAKVAIFGALNAKWDGRFQPFVGVSWLRDGATTPKKDVRQATVGLAGPIAQSGGPADQALTLLSTFQLSQRSDRYASTDGTVARTHFDLVWAPIASGEALGGVSILPHLAALWHRRTGSEPQKGTWGSAYAGILLAKPFELGQQRFRASLVARKIFDTSVPSGNEKRRDGYVTLSLDYYFFDPNDKTAALQPALYITREAGTDFLDYGGKVNKTTAGIRLKFN